VFKYFRKKMLAAGMLSLLPLLAILAAGAPSAEKESGRGRAGKRGILLRRRPPTGYHQEMI
jgi:hypothetical protein